MNDLPGFSFWLSRWPEVLLVAAVGVCIGAALIGYAITWWRARKQRQLDEATDFLARIGFLEADNRGWIPEDLQ